jgi:hypothetical protein
MRVVTATIVSAPVRSPNPTSMSAPGQRNRPRPIADPAPMQKTMGVRAHARTEASTVLAIIVRGGVTACTSLEASRKMRSRNGLLCPHVIEIMSGRA